jgi:glycosyltransferase involved in cell wall biosynthesis
VKVAIVTDAWAPQTNGVVTTLRRTAGCLESFGHEVRVLGPDAFRSVPCPTYPEIRLSLQPGRGLSRFLDGFAPDTVHVATEGPLGLAARRQLRRRRWHFTTSYHTQFPQYLRARAPLPVGWSYAALRWFHSAASRVMVNTPHVRDELAARGFRNLVHWTRGVDTTLFRPRDKGFLDLPRPVFVCVGRVAVEKNIEAFLALDLPGSKLVVGGGPALEQMRRRYPEAHFTGYRYGEELAATVAAADVFVFPSLTDTFGLVMLEAMACGLPVAAFPVTGPLDVVEPGVTGILDTDLRKAALGALDLDPAACTAQARRFTWEEASRQFEAHLVPARG